MQRTPGDVETEIKEKDIGSGAVAVLAALPSN